MANKIFAWVWLILTIFMVLFTMVDTNMDYWLFTFIYFLGLVYFLIKYIEKLK